MTQTPLLSIVTICFNNRDDIERTCKSIARQTWHDFEWIVIDGASTDGTLEILKKYEKFIDVLISEPDTGRYNAMNKGVLRSKGKWLNFMNGGDAFHHPNVLQNLSEFLKNDEADILYGNMNFITNKKEHQIVTYPLNITDPNYFYDGCISHQSSFIKRSLFQQYGLYNENYKIVSDWEKWIVFSLLKCKFRHINLTVADFYDGGIGSSPSPAHIKERETVQQRYGLSLSIQNQKSINIKYYLFGFIPILKIKEQK